MGRTVEKSLQNSFFCAVEIDPAKSKWFTAPPSFSYLPWGGGHVLQTSSPRWVGGCFGWSSPKKIFFWSLENVITPLETMTHTGQHAVSNHQSATHLRDESGVSLYKTQSGKQDMRCTTQTTKCASFPQYRCWRTSTSSNKRCCTTIENVRATPFTVIRSLKFFLLLLRQPGKIMPLEHRKNMLVAVFRPPQLLSHRDPCWWVGHAWFFFFFFGSDLGKSRAIRVRCLFGAHENPWCSFLLRVKSWRCNVSVQTFGVNRKEIAFPLRSLMRLSDGPLPVFFFFFFFFFLQHCLDQACPISEIFRVPPELRTETKCVTSSQGILLHVIHFATTEDSPSLNLRSVQHKSVSKTQVASELWCKTGFTNVTGLFALVFFFFFPLLLFLLSFCAGKRALWCLGKRTRGRSKTFNFATTDASDHWVRICLFRFEVKRVRPSQRMFALGYFIGVGEGGHRIYSFLFLRWPQQQLLWLRKAKSAGDPRVALWRGLLRSSTNRSSSTRPTFFGSHALNHLCPYLGWSTFITTIVQTSMFTSRCGCRSVKEHQPPIWMFETYQRLGLF